MDQHELWLEPPCIELVAKGSVNPLEFPRLLRGCRLIHLQITAL